MVWTPYKLISLPDRFTTFSDDSKHIRCGGTHRSHVGSKRQINNFKKVTGKQPSQSKFTLKKSRFWGFSGQKGDFRIFVLIVHG